jgi:hypothetical protein
MLFRGMRIDFTYLHPEILESKCLIDGNRLILDNKENREEFRVLVVPGGSTIPVATARKILDFYRAIQALDGLILQTFPHPASSEASSARPRSVIRKYRRGRWSAEIFH